MRTIGALSVCETLTRSSFCTRHTVISNFVITTLLPFTPHFPFSLDPKYMNWKTVCRHRDAGCRSWFPIACLCRSRRRLLAVTQRCCSLIGCFSFVGNFARRMCSHYVKRRSLNRWAPLCQARSPHAKMASPSTFRKMTCHVNSSSAFKPNCGIKKSQ